MAGPTIEEVSFFKGISTHPNSISVGPGTFRNILNGWILRDGIIDMRPGFGVDTATPRVPGLSLIPGTTQPSFAGLRVIGTNTFVQNDGRMFWFEPSGVANIGMVAVSAGETLFINRPFVSASNSKYLAISSDTAAVSVSTNYIYVINRTTGELIATRAAASEIIVLGMCFDPINTEQLWWSEFGVNKVFGGTIGSGTITITNTIGSGASGLTTGSPLSGVHVQSPAGIVVVNDGITQKVYFTGMNYVYLANITTDTGSLIAGSTVSGYTNATGASARFSDPEGIGFFNDDLTKLYVADTANSAIRLVTTAGVATTFAGSSVGTPGYTDAIGTAARFNSPKGLCCISTTGTNPDGTTFNGISENTLFIGDTLNNIIRNIRQSDATVSSLVGNRSSSSSLDGPTKTASFGTSTPLGVSFSSDDQNSKIVKIFTAVPDLDPNGSGSFRCIDCIDPVVANNGTPGTTNGSNNLILSTFSGGVGIHSSLTPPLSQRGGFIGGIYNYNNTTPTITASPGTTYNNVMRFFEYGGTTYFNSARGVMAMDLPSTYTTSQIAHYAGAPQGFDLVLTLVGAPGTLLVSDHAAAYRILWGYRTASGRTVQGSPSSRFVITNPSGGGATKNVQIVSQVPPGVTTNWSYQIYRTETVNTVGSTIDPGDTMFLAYEANVLAADLSAGTITVTDATPDVALGQDLYTNATQETLSQANYQPPICLDMCLFGTQSMGIYANTINKSNMFINLVSVTGLSGSPTIVFTFSDGLNGFTITGNSTTPADGVFKYTTSGTVASNIDATARSIVLTINQYTLNRRLRAFYVSPFDGTPGQIAIQENFIGGKTWSITCPTGLGTFFSPVIPVSGTTYQSIPDVSTNGLYVSKIGNPDAVPLVNKFTVGDSSESIRRVFALRESVMIIKERSVWRGTGDTPESFSFTLLDNTVSLRADESCALLNNEVYALTTQGVVAISDNGVRVVARPVEYQLDQIYGTLASPLDLNGLVTSCGSEDYRTYFLSSYKTTSNFTWLLNVFSNAWTRWDPIFQGIGVRNGRIIGAVLQPTAANTFERNVPQIIQQLNEELFENPNAYHDVSGPATPLTINSTTKVITVSYTGTTLGQWQYPFVSQPTVGWIIGGNMVTADDGAGNLTMSSVSGLTVGVAATVLRPINFTMTSNPHNGGATFKIKQWGDFFLCLENQNLFKLSCGFSTNNQSNTDSFSTQDKSVNQTNSTALSAPYYKEQIFKVTIPKAVAGGNLIQWKLSVNQANALVAVKSIGIETRGIDSAKGQQ